MNLGHEFEVSRPGLNLNSGNGVTENSASGEVSLDLRSKNGNVGTRNMCGCRESVKCTFCTNAGKG